MDISPPQFAGAPCGQSGQYNFYKSFRFFKRDKSKELSLGEFFFVRISALDDPCIGELQLLCANKNSDQQLASVRLYFLPEQTPDGRLAYHGEDEVLVASDRVVLKLDDLVSWITEDVDWNHGLIARSCDSPEPKPEDKKEEEQIPEDNSSEENPVKSDECEGQVNNNKELVPKSSNKDELGVLVLSYQSYCRYRTALRRVEGCEDSWLKNALVVALGGFALDNQKTHILFCRDNFDHDELAQHELNCEYLAPPLKGKRRKKKGKNARSTSPESNTSDDGKDSIQNNCGKNGVKQPPCKTEQEFLQRLFKFMKKRNTPIHRVPHLGFKQIDLYVFFSFAQKLGGYDKITCKKLWKHVYDELGGNPGSTSAATCTRRHYERLLLPFEKHLDGIDYKPNQKKKSQKKKMLKDPNSLIEKPDGLMNAEDAYTFTDSAHENSNSKCSLSNEECNSMEEDSAAMNESSDEDSKMVWSIQKTPEGQEEADIKNDCKPIKPLIIQKGQGETFAEMERKWDEIRRKSAAARKWHRSSRSTKGSGRGELSFNADALIKSEEDVHEVPCNTLKIPTRMKMDSLETTKNYPPFSNQCKTSDINRVNSHVYAHLNVSQHHKLESKHHAKKSENLKRHNMFSNQTLDKRQLAHFMKSESWCGYSGNSDHSSYQSGLCPEGYHPGQPKGHLQNCYKTGSQSEPDVAREFLSQHTGRHSVESISASSIVSDEKSLLPQRRPSVIQHTEYAVSPSPSPSPKQTGADVNRNVSPKDVSQTISFSSPKINNLLPSQMSYSTAGKVEDWLIQGGQGAVACKTPSSKMEKTLEYHDKVMMASSCKTPSSKIEKTLEYHDKVMMASSCKTPGIGTGKGPANTVRSKLNAANGSKSPKSKNAASQRHRNSEGTAGGARGSTSKGDIRNSSLYHNKSFHPATTSYNSTVMNNVSVAQRHDHNLHPPTKLPYYSSVPHYNQPKHFKPSMAPSLMAVGPRPPLIPHSGQQMYRTSPLIDVPKGTTYTHNDYENAVLDLSVKKKQPEPSPPAASAASVSTLSHDQDGCLDLSMKKRLPHLSSDNGIENITPPLPLSPMPHQTPYLSSPSLKPLPTLISLQDLASEEALKLSGMSRPPSMMPVCTTASMPVLPPNAAMYLPGKPSQNIISALHSAALSKELAKGLYMPSNARNSQFSPYVIPPFFPSNWTAVMNAATSSSKQANNSQPSPMTYKSNSKHSMYPKDYPYNAKSQFHNSHHPSSNK